MVASQPSTFTRALELPGLNVLSLMHENTAFAFKYGFDKEVEFSTDKPTNVVFYNMGASAYQARVE
jgi:molecular chaperone DnaK (HSP70)